MFFIAHRNSCPKSSSAGRFRYVPRSHPPNTLKNTVFFTFSARLAQPRGQHPPHHRHHLHQCPPWMRMMQAMPGMLSTMGTPQKTLVFDTAGSRSKSAQNTPEHPFPPGSEVTAQKYSAWSAHGRRWSAAQGKKGRAQQHEPQHVKGLRCWLIRCMLAKHSAFYCTPKFLPKIEFGRDRRGLPVCSTFAPAKHLEIHCVFSRFRQDWPNLGVNIPRITGSSASVPAMDADD